MLTADFSARTLEARREWQNILKVIEGKKSTNKITLFSKDIIQIQRRNQKLYRQAKVERIQYHQTSFTTNAKGTSLGRRHKRRKRPTENKHKTIKKMIIGSYILIITLNVNRLNAPKDTDWLGQRKHMHVCTST